MTRPDAPRRCPRPGFTLVELLVVLLILALLIALLLPAVTGAVRAARSAAVQAEINTIAQALASFKSKFGEYPPSRVILSESGLLPSTAAAVSSGASDDISVALLSSRSMTVFRKFWPQVSLSTGSTTNWYDFNGNGVNDQTGSGNPAFYIVQGHESLVFFLGGIPLLTDGHFSATGFGKNNANPFTNSIIGNAGYSANRNPPFFEFASDRLITTSTQGLGMAIPTASQPFFLSGIPGYIDSLNSQAEKQNFYAYFSNTAGVYDPNDVNLGIDHDNDGTSPIGLDFTPTSPLYGGSALTRSPSPNPYTTSPSVPSGSQPPTFVSPQSYQIVSPGLDGVFGLGGQYVANSTDSPLPPAGAASNAEASVRNLERDNLTSFHNGRLE